MNLMENIPLMAAGLAGVAALLAGFGIMGMSDRNNRTKHLKRRLNTCLEPEFRTPESTGMDKLTNNAREVFEKLGNKLGSEEGVEAVKKRDAMTQAGIRNPRATAIFQGVKVVLTLLLAGAFFGIKTLFLKDLSLQWTIFGTVGMAFAGCYLPEMWLRSKVDKRKEAITNELPDALDLLVVCVEAGMGLDQAIHRVSTELMTSAPTLCWEFRQLTLELRAGVKRKDALKNLADRVALDDLNSLVALLTQADVFGISVGRTLRVYSDSLRTKRYQRAEEKAAKLPVKMLIPLAICILPALFVAIIGPAGLRLMEAMSHMG